MAPKYPEIEVPLLNDGNGYGSAFRLIERVNDALREAQCTRGETEFTLAAADAENYDQLLDLVMATVSVSWPDEIVAEAERRPYPGTRAIHPGWETS